MYLRWFSDLEEKKKVKMRWQKGYVDAVGVKWRPPKRDNGLVCRKIRLMDKNKGDFPLWPPLENVIVSRHRITWNPITVFHNYSEDLFNRWLGLCVFT